MEKRVLSLLLAIAMIVAMLPQITIPALAADADTEETVTEELPVVDMEESAEPEEEPVSSDSGNELTLDTPYEVVVEEGSDGMLLSFTPEESGVYIIASDASGDTVATLYDSEMVYLVDDDDGGYDNNFMISWSMEAGKTYYLKARFYGNSGGTFPVTVSRSPVAKVEVEPITLYEESSGDYQYAWNSETQENSLEWFQYSWGDRLSYTVTMTDGTVAKGDSNGFEYNGVRYYPVLSSNQYYLERWLPGNTYEDSMSVMGYEVAVPVTIVESPVVSVTVEPLTMIQETGGYFSGDWNQDEGRYDNEFYYYYWWNYIQYQITFADGTVIDATGQQFEYDGQTCYLKFRNEQSGQNPWLPGQTYDLSVRVMGYAVDTTVTIEESPIASIAVEPITIVQGTYGQTDWDEGNEYYRYNWIYKLRYTAALKDGSTFSASLDGFEYNGQYYNIRYWDDQGYDNTWTAGNTYEATISVMGYEAQVPVTIVDSAITSIEMKPISIIEETNGSGYFYDRQEGYEYNWLNLMEYTVTFIDGTVTEGTGSELYYNGSTYIFEGIDDQTHDNPWLPGNTYTAQASVLGFTVDVSVTIEPTPIESLVILPISIMENTNGGYSEEENGTYYNYWWWNEIKYVATFTDGTQVEGSGQYLYYNDMVFYLTYSDGQSYETPWTAGNTYTVRVSTNGISTEATIEICASPIVSITAEPISILEGTNGYTSTVGTSEGTVEYYYYQWWYGLNCTVTFADGGVVETTSLVFTYNGEQYRLDSSDNQYYTNAWTAGNTYNASVTLLDKTCNIPVTIIQSPVKSVVINDLSIPAGTGGSFRAHEGAFYKYRWWEQMTYTVTFSDGTTYEGSGSSVVHDGMTYEFTVSDTQNSDNRWTVGNTYYPTVSLLGKEVTIAVTIAEASADSIDLPQLALDAEQDAAINENGECALFKFTPEVSGNYTFTSYAGMDTYGYLLDTNFNVLASDDDDGDGNNFMLTEALEAGRTYIWAARFYSGDNTGSFPVKLTKQLGIASVTLEPITLMEGMEGGTVVDGPDGSAGYFRYYWWNRIRATVAFEDGGSVSMSGYDLWYNDIYYRFDWTDDQSPLTPWTVGNTYTVQISAGGCTASTTVTIEESPVRDIVFGTTVVYAEGNGYYMDWWNADTQSYEQKFYYYWWQSLPFTVNFKDGTAVSGMGNGFYYNDQWNEFNHSDSQYSTPWEVGKTYYPTVSFGGIDYTVTVTVVKAPITSVVVEPMVLLAETGGYYMGSAEPGQPYAYYWWNNLRFTVNFENGTSVNGYGTGFSYNGSWLQISYQDNQSYDNPWVAGGSYTPTIRVMGYEAQVQVSITDSIGGSAGENATWTLTNDGTLTISGTGAMYYYSSSNDMEWFEYREGIKNVVISSGITETGRFAFYSCYNLESATIADTVTDLGDYTFYGCSNLSQVTISDSVTRIGENAFRDCVSLTEITLGNGVQTIGNYAFAYCTNLTTVSLPASLKEIQHYAFGVCVDLTDVYYAGTQTAWRYITFNGDNADLWNATIHCTGVAETVASGELDEITWTVDSDGVLSISGTGVIPDFSAEEPAPWAAYVDSIRVLTLGEEITEIGSYAFYGCEALFEAYIYGVKTVEASAFENCTDLGAVYFDPVLETIEANAFNNTGIYEVYYQGPGYAWYSENIMEGNDVLFDAYLYSKEEEGVIKSGACGDALIWVLDETGTLTITGEGAMYDYDFRNAPWRNVGYPVMRAEIGEGVTYIGWEAFADCWNISEVIIPGTVTEIGCLAFANCYSLKTVTIPEGVVSIGDEAFACCEALSEVSLPSTLTSIGFESFGNCASLTQISIPAGVTGIGHSAFFGCGSLTQILVDEANAYYTSDEDGVLYNKEKTELIRAPGAIFGAYTVAAGVEQIGISAFSDCWNLTSVVIPDSVTYIGPNAFHNCMAMTEVTLGSGVTFLEYGVFSNTGLTSVALHDGITAIGSSAFQDCDSLTEIVIPDSVTEIGDHAFAWCTGLSSVTIPAGVTTMGEYVFAGCDLLQEVVIPEGVTAIGSYAFADCFGLTTVSIPATVESIGAYAFIGCTNLTSVEVGENVTAIGDSAFEGCTNLVEVDISGGVTDFVYRMFAGCASLETITIPESVQSIGNQTFADCTGLTSITVPDSVTSIGDKAFYECNTLAEITLGKGVELLGDDLFYNCNSLAAIRVSEENPYYSSDETGVFFDKEKTVLLRCPVGLSGSYTIPDTVTELGYDAFYGCNQLTEITIPGSVSVVGDGAFFECTGLETVNLCEGITEIGHYAFSGCISLQSIIIPNGVTYIGSDAFSDCYSLVEVVIPEGITQINPYAFAWCYSLEQVTLPASLENIYEWAFVCCDCLTDVIYAGTAAQWAQVNVEYGNDILYGAKIHYEGGNALVDSGTCGEELFWSLNTFGKLTIQGTGAIADYSFDSASRAPWSTYADQITMVEIAEGVTAIGSNAFYGMTELEEVIVPATVTTIDNQAFWGCGKLSAVQLSEGLEHIGNNAFAECRSLREISLPDSLKTLGNTVFAYCLSLTELFIPAGVESIDGDLFYNCESLTAIVVDENNAYYSSDGSGVLFNKDKTELLRAPCAISGAYVIPGTVARIAGYAFFPCANLQTLMLPVSVKRVDAFAFYCCDSLTQVHYEGTTYQWESMEIYENNDPLINATRFTADPTLTGISVTTLPNITDYIVGQALDLTGMVITATYSDGSEVQITEGFAVEGYDPNTLGTQTLTVTYENSVAEFTVTVNHEPVQILAQPADQFGELGTEVRFAVEATNVAAYRWQYRRSASGTWYDTSLEGYKTDTLTVEITSGRNGYQYRCKLTGNDGAVIYTDAATLLIGVVELTGITVTEMPNKTQYEQGEQLDTTGMVVVANYNNGTSVELTEGYTVEGFDAANVGVQTVTVVYGEFSATFEITVLAPTVVAVELISAPDKTEYVIGELLNVKGLALLIKFSNGTTETKDDAFSTYGYDPDTLGEQTVTVAYEGFTVTFQVTVTEKPVEIITQPADQTGVAGTNAQFAVEAMNVASYRWQYRRSASGAWYDTSLEGYKTDTLTVEITSGRDGYQYRCKLTGNDGSVVYTEAATLTVGVVELTGITVPKAPDKMQYFIGESLDLTGIVVLASYNNDTVEELTEGYTVEGFDSATSGTQTITVSYQGFSATFEVTVLVPEVVSVELSSAPGKTEYVRGEALDTEGLALLVAYSNGVTADVFDGFLVEGFDPDTLGEQTVTVTYEGFSVSFEVVVNEKPVQIITQPADQSAPAGTEVYFSVAAENVVSYRWQYRRNATGKWFNTTMTGYKSDTLTVAVTAGRNGYQYRCELTGKDENVYYTDAATLTAEPAQLVSLTIATYPDKLEYLRYEELDLTGLTLAATYTDGSTEVITEGFTVDGFSSNYTGRKQITISYEDHFAFFSVEVIYGTGTCGDNLTWKLDSYGLLTISGTGEMYDYVSDWDMQPWGADRQSIRNVIIEDGVTTVGVCAFYACENLESVIIADTVNEIRNNAFAGCSSLTSVKMSANIKHIRDFAFATCHYVKEFELPEGLLTIGVAALACDGYTSITVPSTVCDIGDLAFCGGWEFAEIIVSPDNQWYSNDEHGVLFNKDKTEIITIPSGMTGSYTIPDSVTVMGENAIYELYNLKEITIGKNVTRMPWTRFCYELERINIPVSVTHIGEIETNEKLSEVHYEGTKAQWDKITFDYAYTKRELEERLYTRAPEVTELAFFQFIQKVVYSMGEQLDLTDLILTVFFDDGTSTQIDEGFTVEGYDPFLPGEQTVTIGYEGAIIEFVVTVLTQDVEITGQPGSQEGSAGSSVQFAVTAENAKSYQWQYSRNGGTSWMNTSMDGYNTDTLTVPVTAARNGYRYRCIVTGENGSQVISDSAELTVKVEMAITEQPEDVTALVGAEALFTVGVTGDNLSYRWQYRRNATASWLNTSMAGYNTRELCVEVTAAREGYQYRCIIKDLAGNSVTSEAATLHALRFVAQPADQSAPVGENVSFSVTVTHADAVAYKWQYRRSATGAWFDTSMSGYNTDTLTVGVTSGRNGYQYRCLIITADGSEYDSDPATLSVETKKDPAVIVTQPADQTASVGENAIFAVEATGAATYRWQYSRNGGTSWISTSMTGYNTDELTVPVIASRNGYQYRCVITGEDGTVLITDPATLTVG